ncbi:hypothetical protein JW968_01280 [Candidatus Woesearchaeota archaeon]|nr:hypothetical protein [Candidatus Woesearchaeota archaeon]
MRNIKIRKAALASSLAAVCIACLLIILPAGEAAKASGGNSGGGSPVLMKGSSPLVMKNDNSNNEKGQKDDGQLGTEGKKEEKKQDEKNQEQKEKETGKDKPGIENLGQEIKGIMMERKAEWKMTIGDLRETGYKGPVSDFVHALNEQTKMLKDEVMAKMIENNMTQDITESIAKRLDAKYREQAAKQRRITKEEKRMAFGQIDPEAAEIIEGFDEEFQNQLYINVIEGDQELIDDIRILDQSFEIYPDLNPEDLEGLDERGIMEKITRGGNNEKKT